jgi:signal transduction histidine kinase
VSIPQTTPANAPVSATEVTATERDIASASGVPRLARASNDPVSPSAAILSGISSAISSGISGIHELEGDWSASSDPLIAKKRALAQLVVHDLRNPLSAAHGYVQLAKEDLASGTVDPLRVRDYLDDVSTLLDKALGLVATILDVEELEDGLLRAHPSEITFAELIRRAQAGHTRQYERRGLTFSIEGVVEAPLLLDVDMIGRVVENLLDNAARYAPRGGRVVASARWVGDDIELAIGNSGPPVPPRDRETIFGRYYQIEARRASARANRGLGLYFCKLAVGAHGGSIVVETRGELGAVFVVRIPRAIAAPPATSAPAP